MGYEQRKKLQAKQEKKKEIKEEPQQKRQLISSSLNFHELKHVQKPQ